MSQMEEVMKALLKSSNHCGDSGGSVGQRGDGRMQAVNGLVDITIDDVVHYCLVLLLLRCAVEMITALSIIWPQDEADV